MQLAVKTLKSRLTPHGAPEATWTIGDSEDLVVAGRTLGLRPGRVSPGGLFCAIGPGLPEPVR